MPNMKIFIMLMVVACQVSADIAADVARYGRRVQVDGFLLEWDRQNAAEWGGGSLWAWDALNTADGVAGYFASRDATPCSSWTFTIGADGKPIVIKVPEQTAGEFFAFDKGTFESAGIYTIEWLVPWDIIGDENAVTVNAADSCGSALETLRLNIVRESPPDGSYFIYIVITFVLIAIIAAAYMYIRRKSKRKA